MKPSWIGSAYGANGSRDVSIHDPPKQRRTTSGTILPLRTLAAAPEASTKAAINHHSAPTRSDSFNRRGLEPYRANTPSSPRGSHWFDIDADVIVNDIAASQRRTSV